MNNEIFNEKINIGAIIGGKKAVEIQ